MPMKGARPDLRAIDRWDGGVGWLAYPDEGMRRASHAVVAGEAGTESGGREGRATDDAAVWVLDPVDAPGVDDLLADLGTVAGVVVCLDRHRRDAATVAARHDVPVFLPEWMDGVAERIDAPVERFGRELADTGYRAVRVRDAGLPRWQEVALVNDAGTLYVPEAVGTAPFFRASGERLGVHPMLRLTPPRRALGGLDPQRVLVGHGEGVTTDASAALREALAGARRRAPAAYVRALTEVLSGSG